MRKSFRKVHQGALGDIFIPETAPTHKQRLPEQSYRPLPLWTRKEMIP